MKWKRRILSQEQEKKIETRIAEFEEKTGTDLVVSIHRASSTYKSASLRFTLFFVLAMVVLGSEIFTTRNFVYTGLYCLVVLAFGLGLGRVPAFNQICRSKKEIQRKVWENATKFFHIYRIYETSHRTGCLFCISLEERKLNVLVDKALDAKLSKSDMRQIVEMLTQNFKGNNYYEGILTSISILEAKFLQVFPEKVVENHKGEIRNRIRFQGRHP